MQNWDKNTWKFFPAKQQPMYVDHQLVDQVVSQLSSTGQPIVDPKDIDLLLYKLGDVYESENEVLFHGGDCAETFESCNSKRVERDVVFLNSMSLIISSQVTIGRICGQFGKPRSCHFESGGIPVFRGDIINSVSDRNHCALNMLTAHQLMLDMVKYTESIYISHECLLLPFESSLVRNEYATSAHFLWIGDRTRQLNGAHVEFCRGIKNPIGIKVGPISDPEEIREIVLRVNPENIAGKVTVITRYGSGNVEQHLKRLIQKLKGLKVLWQCDPMHGNTVVRNGWKTREIDDIKHEIFETVQVHRAEGSRLHGIHLEATGADVIECVQDSNEEVVGDKYESVCDPRLNPEQTRDVLEFLKSTLTKNETSRCSSRTTTDTSFEHSRTNSEVSEE